MPCFAPQYKEMARGLIDAHLRGGVVKKRVAVPGRGKSVQLDAAIAAGALREIFHDR